MINKILAIPIAAWDIPVNPNIPAIKAIMKNKKDQASIESMRQFQFLADG